MEGEHGGRTVGNMFLPSGGRIGRGSPPQWGEDGRGLNIQYTTYMQPQKYLKKLAANIVQRSGLSRPTVEALLPHVFDEIRHQLCEGNYKCVPIESFGTFAVIERPEHKYLYHRGDVKVEHTVPAKRVIRFAPTRNMQREVEAQQMDPSRKSFSRHPDDRAIRKRKNMRYVPPRHYNREEGAWGRPLPSK